MTFETALDIAAVLTRWAARVLGALLALMFLAFFVGEGIAEPQRLSPREMLMLLGFALAVVGLGAAWWRPVAGGATAIAGYLLHAACAPRSAANPFIAAIFVIGVMHMGTAARLSSAATTRTVWRVPRQALLAGGALLGVFILLAANEAFGMPPLMTPALHQGSKLAGTWTAAQPGGIRFTIHQDCSVTGEVGTVAVISARVMRNRSWFGQLMNWRTEYMVVGRLAAPARLAPNAQGDRFTAPFNWKNNRLRGSLFLNKRPVRLDLGREN